ncbi:restriction endonuclease subunit S, partial [Micromonospora sp. LOL_023]|uniref:restriction endonuclease subunit S n=1 Tax=Micromonospora sp. LOL_023 TaxID=3345418 RepID=UPI003A879350
QLASCPVLNTDRTSQAGTTPGPWYVGLENIESGGGIAGVGTVGASGVTSGKFVFDERHVLYGKLRPYLAKIALPNFCGVCSTDILPVLPGANLDRRYLAYFLRVPANVDLATSRSSGANLPRLSPKELMNFSIPLPPLEEQRRIADVLDRVDALRAKRASVGHNSRLLPQSVFVQMFGSPSEIPDRWPLRPFDHLVSEFRYGTSIKSGEIGYPTLRIPNIVAGSVDVDDLKLVDVSLAELGRLRLVDGDLLFVRTNGNPDYVGRCAVFDSADMSRQGVFGADVIYASYLIRARVNSDLVHPVYVREYLNGPIGRSSMRERSKTSAGQYNVNTAGLGSIPIPVPPLDRQQRFVESVTGVERTWGVQRRALGELDALFASLQHRAFRGEL